MSQEVSHGRGGAGNIIHDDTPYVDGEIVRAGPEGSHDDGPYSTGRGGELLMRIVACAGVIQMRSGQSGALLFLC